MDKKQGQQREILLVPLGKVLMDILEEIAVALRKTYKMHVRIGRSEEPETSAYLDSRRQFNADSLLTIVSARKRDVLAAVLGVVDADMFSGEKAFIFGVHLPERHAAVLALARLREEFYKKPGKRELFFRRAVTEAIFQVGMALGLPPCAQKKCVLQPGTSLWRLDEKSQNLCVDSQARLEEVLRFTPNRKEPALPSIDAAASEALIAEDELGQTPAGEDARVIPNSIESEDRTPVENLNYDENEMAAGLVEPEGPQPAEEAALHIERERSEGPQDRGV